MATQSTVQRMLERIASNYSKHPKWAEDNAATWSHGLQKYPDQIVVAAVKRWIGEHTRAPNVANLRGIIQSFPTQGEPDKPPGCKRCDYTGRVEVAHHYSDKHGGSAKCVAYSAACSCPAGARLAMGPYKPFDLFVDFLRSNPYTLAVYHSTHDRPFLTEIERNTPQAITDREERQRANMGKHSGFKPVSNR